MSDMDNEPPNPPIAGAIASAAASAPTDSAPPAAPTPTPTPTGRPRRLPPVLVEVVSVTALAPRLVAVTVSGAPAERFGQAAPTSHIKILLPAPDQAAPTLPTTTASGERVWPEGEPRPTLRTYTPRSFDIAAGTLEIQFVLHERGPASDWARRARPGDRIAIGGPGGRFSADLTTPNWWIAGDESALPAIGTLLDALDPSVRAEVHIEVAGPEDEIALDSGPNTTVSWHHRRAPDAWGAELRDLADAAQIAPDTQIWVACEATAMRAIRRHFLSTRSNDPSALITRGYWRAGAADHPDHDYGED